ncbi:hypothetical protein [Flavobacterium piscinae]|uniref:hypothetical protein n=1 Tax=Flavobacterium piscinae TaxID=2506424 RepID=UPI002AAB5F5C|nr:hypothetical protein [Flavobacterium piscinae]
MAKKDEFMEFHDFLKFVPKIAKESLPAKSAHLKMAPLFRQELLNKIDYNSYNPKKGRSFDVILS